MTGVSILNDKLKSFDYYKQKLPLYLQNSYGFIEHFRIWYQILTSEDTTHDSISVMIDKLFELLNIFDLNCTQSHSNPYDGNQHYLEFLNNLEDSDDGTVSDILDKIGSLFGLRRKFSIVIENVEYNLNLNNKDFLTFIKCTIIRNYFDGTYLELHKYYESVALPVFILNDTDPATCKMELIDISNSVYAPSEDIKKLFLAGQLTVESMGIEYTYIVTTLDNYAIFDSDILSHTFDNGVFVS